MRTRRAFLVEKLRQGFDLSTVKEYAEVDAVFNDGDRRSSLFAVEDFSADVVRQLERKSFDPDLDYLLVAGGTVQVVLTALAVVGRWGRVSLLLFNSTEDCYIPRKVVLDGAGDSTVGADGRRETMR
jgi:threonine dehydrogenase-like Zn-dependent dehydrogenase